MDRSLLTLLRVAAAVAPTFIPASASSGSNTLAAPGFANPAFERLWQRTDYPVQRGDVARTWFWGPQPGESTIEPAPAARNGSHQVQYFDKARMEINDPTADPRSPWYVTNGLLTVELLSGHVDGLPEGSQPGVTPDTPLASDANDTSAPTYASFSQVADVPGSSKPATNATGRTATATIDRAGHVGNDSSRERYGAPAVYAHFEPATKHNIVAAFWDFLNSTDLVYEGTQTKLRLLSDPWFYATGYPISEAYWADVLIAWQRQPVLIQAFQRRVLTYVPGNPSGWRVQMGNIGRHYHDWRYGASPGPSSVPIVAAGRIAFTSTRDGKSGIYTMSPSGAGLRLVAAPEGVNLAPRFGPEGSLAFANIPPGPQGRAPLMPPQLDPSARIMLAQDTDGSPPTALASTSVPSWQGQSDPALSPNGMFLAFRGRPDGEKAGLFLANLASDAALIPVTRLTTGDWDRQPAWSPDGTRLAFTTASTAADAQIALIRADGSGLKRFGSPVQGIVAQDPGWSPDGRRIIFATNAALGKFDIITMSDQGMLGPNLTGGNGSNQHSPSYSPDGKWLAFATDKFGAPEVVVAPADGSRWSNITNNSAADTEPSWGR